MELDKTIIGQNLKRLRTSKQLSMLEFAQKLGYKGASTYFHIEKGEGSITIDFLNNVCQVFGVQVGELVGSGGGANTASQLRELEARAREFELYKAVSAEYVHQLLWELAALKGVTRENAEEGPCRVFFGTEVVAKLFKAGMVADRQLLALWERYGEG